MINIEDKKAYEIIERIHTAVEQKGKKGTHIKKEIVTENRVISVMCNDFTMEPVKCARIMNKVYGEDLTVSDVVQILRRRRMANPVERKSMFEWADEITEYFEKAVMGDNKSFEKYKILIKRISDEFVKEKEKKYRCPERIVIIMMYEKYPEINQFDDMEKVYSLGNTLARHFFYDICDIISDVHNFHQYVDERKKISTKTRNKMTYEQALRRIDQLENILDRTNIMLQELQDEFDEQLETSKVTELADFFAKLNSDKYGCILDELVMVRKGVDELRKSNYQLPIEINGLLIMVKKLIQFVMDCHINPIMKLNSVKEVVASDIEFCNYEGTPFKTPDEKKKIKVVSPGWIYKDKELQISRPKVKEVN